VTIGNIEKIRLAQITTLKATTHIDLDH
jgi:hypothetical protein